MLDNTNKYWASMTDAAIISSIGLYIKQERLKQNRTQVDISEDANVNRWTLSQIEKGEAISLRSLIQILRALKSLSVFDSFKIITEISPLKLAKEEQKKRKRASGNNSVNEKENDW